jgi:hypothetical protein
MILHILEVKLAGPTSIDVRFNDGSCFVVDLKPLLTGPVFESLRNADEFAKFSLDPVCKMIVWPDGADLAPEPIRDLAMAEQSVR